MGIASSKKAPRKVTSSTRKPRHRRTSSSPRRYTKEDDLKKKIKSSDWFIVTINGCGYCKESKNILKSRKEKYKSIVLNDKNQDKIWAVTDKIAKKKYRYFPMIFRNGKFLGGYKELINLI
jgi:glutaredoxin